MELKIKRTNTVKLSVLNIDKKLKFDLHFSKQCSKVAMELNALSRHKKVGAKTKKP